MAGSRFRTTAVSLALLAALAVAAYFTGLHSLPADHADAVQTSSAKQGSATPGADQAIREESASTKGASPGETGSSVGFASRKKLEQHYQKHGAEFGSIGMDEYLRRAQTLRDRPAGGGVLECVRADGVITRYDRASGAFLAFNPDRTIRTFFRPNDGEDYFHRQCQRGAR